MHSVSSKRKPNEYIKLSATLFAITFIVALLLAMVNFVTSEKIAAIQQEKLEVAMATVLPEAATFENAIDKVGDKWDGQTELLGVQLAKDKNGEVMGVCVEVAPKGYSNIIDMMVGINAEGEITDTSIISLADTPGIGTQIEEEGFLGQFVGKSGSLTAVKGSANGQGEVSLISGATYSSGGFTEGVNAALQVYKIVMEEGAK